MNKECTSEQERRQHHEGYARAEAMRRWESDFRQRVGRGPGDSERGQALGQIAWYGVDEFLVALEEAAVQERPGALWYMRGILRVRREERRRAEADTQAEARTQAKQPTIPAGDGNRPSDPRAQELWERALQELEHQVTRSNFETWLRHTAGVRLRGTALTVAVPSDFALAWLQGRMRPLILKTLGGLLGGPASVEFTVAA